MSANATSTAVDVAPNARRAFTESLEATAIIGAASAMVTAILAGIVLRRVPTGAEPAM